MQFPKTWMDKIERLTEANCISKCHFSASYMIIQIEFGDIKIFGIKKIENFGCVFLWILNENTIVCAIAWLSAPVIESFTSGIVFPPGEPSSFWSSQSKSEMK